MRYLLVAFVVAIAFAGTAPGPVRAQEVIPEIEWRDCDGLDCGTVDVPLNYFDLEGPTIELALLRIPARQQDNRIGVLMVNPGGPGGSAIDFAAIWQLILDNDIRNRFDIVAFDPRGVGESTPILCHDTLQDLVAIDPDPDDEAEWEAAKRAARIFAEDCARAAGDILPHVGTRNVARDMDLIRQSLGEEQITYVGYSYGTTIGSVFASMFPSSVRAMVLDGGTDLSLDFVEVNRTQMIGFERAFEAYLQNCVERGCALAEDGDPREAVQRVIAAAEESPIPAPGADRDAGPGEVQLGIISALYSPFTWNRLTNALVDALEGDGTGLVELTDSYLQRDGSGDYSNLIEANSAVNYVDYTCPKDPEEYRELGEIFAEDAPTFGRSASTSGLICAYWDVEPEPLDPPTGAGAPPIVVIATTNDPATPYEWGAALAEQLESGILVTYRGEGHTIYALGNSCIDDVVNGYLLNLALPAEGTTCGNGPPPPAGSQPGAEETPPSEGDPTPTPGTATEDDPDPPATAAAGSPTPGSDELGSTTWYWVAAIVLLLITVIFLGVAYINTRSR